MISVNEMYVGETAEAASVDGASFEIRRLRRQYAGMWGQDRLFAIRAISSERHSAGVVALPD